MLEKVVALDTQLLIYLNSLGSPTYDGFWLFITKQSNWTPFFLIVLYLVYKKLGTKPTLVLLLFVALLLLVSDQTCNLFKYTFQRLRPCNNPEIKSVIRIVKSSDTFSFFSGHAANSMATMTFLFLLLKKYYRYAFLLFLFPLIFAYSRIYLGLHYPLDILTGYLVGATFGFIAYKLYQKYVLKYSRNG
nr:phosphatase PAP2 family protein [uncultured Flavobacterium sp.]